MNDINYSDLFNLKNKNIIVIGAASGIGYEACNAIASHNANLICADINTDKIKTLSSILSKKYSDSLITYKTVDILKRSDLENLIDQFDKLDGLVCTPSMNVRKLIKDYTEEEFDNVINLNLKATFNTIQLASVKMSVQKNGSIIAFSSIRGTVVEPGQSVYAATKAGTEKLVNTLASEVGKFNVRVNTISPGPVMTPLTNQLRENTDWNNAYKTKPALNRWAEPHELTGGIVYLLSDASTYVTGSNLRIDGGWIAHDGRFNPEI